jgi:hypothetical protein
VRAADCLPEPVVRALPAGAFVRVVSGPAQLSGLWWFSVSGLHVGYESWLERDQLMVLDADADVVLVAFRQGMRMLHVGLVVRP